MIYTGLNNTGEVEAIYGHLNGVKSEVSEVYGSIDYNDPIFYSRKTLTGTSPLTFKALGQPLKDYHIFGETFQDGTPSPDYPVDVQGVGERTENLFDAKKIVNDSDNVSTFIYGDYLRFGTGANTMIINVNANSEGSYTISFDVFNATVGGNNIRFSVSYDDGTTEITPNFVISDIERHKYTFATNNNKKLLRFETINTSSKVSYIVIDTAMLIEGTTAIPYEPYGYKIPVTIGNVTTPIYIGSDPLYRIGDYADEIDFANQQIIRRIKKVIINGTESMTVVGPYGGGKYKLRYRGIANSGICSGKEKDTHFRTTTKNMDGLLDGEMSFIGISSSYVDFCKDTTMRSLQNWRDYFAEQYSAGTPVIILYVLATPTTESVTIPTLTTITGDNALSIGTTIQPSAVSITGHIKPTGYGRLLDANDVDIRDSTGEPIYIQG